MELRTCNSQMPLWHIDYFKPKATEKQQIRKDALFSPFQPKKHIIKFPCTRKRRTFLSPESGNQCQNGSVQTY